MTSNNDAPRGAHLVGSVPLVGSEDVFRSVATILPQHLRRTTDGETGGRSAWVGWQFDTFAKHPSFEVLPPPPGKYAVPTAIRLRDGVDPADLTVGPLGYAAAAEKSFAEFMEFKEAGVLPEHIRFQVSLPTPLAPIIVLIAEEARAAVLPAFEAAMLRELDMILEAIPHEQLTIQWDVCQEVGVREGVYDAPFNDPGDDVLDGLERIAGPVPADVELGYHLCYGDYGHEHFKQPADTAVVTRLANEIAERVAHEVGYVHLPVPRDRSDAAYFAPLADLSLDAQTELYLGLLHFSDGVDGARRRIAAARSVIGEFGVATECGLGRRPRNTIIPLLRLHREVAQPIA